jgi:hypothetical protein
LTVCQPTLEDSDGTILERDLMKDREPTVFLSTIDIPFRDAGPSGRRRKSPKRRADGVDVTAGSRRCTAGPPRGERRRHLRRIAAPQGSVYIRLGQFGENGSTHGHMTDA